MNCHWGFRFSVYGKADGLGTGCFPIASFRSPRVVGVALDRKGWQIMQLFYQVNSGGFLLLFSNQCCGPKTFCFRSGSDFQKVSAPAPTLALYLPFITDFILKIGFLVFFMKEYQSNSHAGFYTIWILIFIYYSSWPGARAGSQEPEPKLWHSGSPDIAFYFRDYKFTTVLSVRTFMVFKFLNFVVLCIF